MEVPHQVKTRWSICLLALALLTRAQPVSTTSDPSGIGIHSTVQRPSPVAGPTRPFLAKIPTHASAVHRQAGSGGIIYTCDPTINAVNGVCNTLNTVIAGLYSSAFTNANASIYVTFGNTGLGASNFAVTSFSYSGYRNALIASESSTNDVTAVNDSVPATSPFGSNVVMMTNPNLRGLGFAPTLGIDLTGNVCTLSKGGCYDGVITLSTAMQSSNDFYYRTGSITSSQYDFFSVTEHETDEILGTASCVFGCSVNNSSAFAPADLFRYHSNGTRSFATGGNNSCAASDSVNACFSLNGTTMLQQYNNVNDGNDAGDWVTNCSSALVQDTHGCPGVANIDISPAELVVLDVVGFQLQPSAQGWTAYGENAQHTALSSIPAEQLDTIVWQTPVDQNLAGTSGHDIYAHFGSAIVSSANTMFVPVHASSGSYEVQVFNGSTASGSSASPKWTLASDWTPPSSTWAPSFSPGLSSRNRFYYAGAGGTVYYLDNPDTNPGPPGQVAFYGTSLYLSNPSAYQNSVMISTPIVGDAYGNIFFGFIVTGSSPPRDQNGVTLQSGIARITASGEGDWISALNAANGIDSTLTHVPLNSAPALSLDSQTLYFAVSNSSQNGYLVSIHTSTLTPIAQVHLIDPNTSAPAQLLDISSAAPVVGPDGDVYYGVFESSCCTHNDRGWLLHFNASLVQSKIPGSFGWDDTPSVVPSSLVPSYAGQSSYLLLSKYNNYANTGGNGQNKLAILDPAATEPDPITPAVAVMNEVITILGPTPDPTGPPGAVKEWCINSAAIDQPNKSALVNSEDGYLYRWDFTTNSFTQKVQLTAGVGEAYTPTVIGSDGTTYAINDAILFAVRTQPSQPALSIAKMHSGNFIQGQTGATYLVTVSNEAGAAATQGTVTVTDTLPTGLILGSMAGTGWACNGNSCTRSNPLAGGSNYPSITVTVNVNSTATSPQVNQVSVSGGGSVGSSASDSTTIVALVMSLSETTLNYGSGGGLITDPQTVTVSFSGASVNWTASSNRSNVVVSPTSGIGLGTLTITASAGPSATITVTAAGAANSPQTIAVNIANVTPGVAFGSFDTPVTTGNPTFAGAIAVTGWALDSIEVTGVDIWREPVTGEPGTNLIFIGNATFVPGARPDVQADYPSYPLNYRAGWGLQVLTNELPNSTGSGPIGNGTFNIHAIAHNKTGSQTDLGTKTITVNNAAATLPFGTIDTPTQGQTVSGTVVNFGWALTPPTVGCPGVDQPCIIPVNGLTLVVYIDNNPVGNPVYNFARCDVDQDFPNYANSGSTNCANNGTSPGPVGYYTLDTTTLTNGLHAIQWSVTDNAGRVSGIGSRYFTVVN